MAESFARVKCIFGSEADWAANDIVLLAGEIAFADVGGDILGKVGDGTSLWSELAYSIGSGNIPLAGTVAGSEVTGTIHFDDIALGKTYSIGIENGNSVDNFIIRSTPDGINEATAEVWISASDLTWKFANDGKLTAPDVLFEAGDDLVLVNKGYVDSAVAGGVSADYIPLSGNLDTGAPVSGLIEHYNATLDQEYVFGIVEGLGVDGFAVSSSGSNLLDCTFTVIINGYQTKFDNAGRVQLPVITYGAGDAQAAASKAFVDQLRQDCIDAGVAISAPT